MNLKIGFYMSLPLSFLMQLLGILVLDREIITAEGYDLGKSHHGSAAVGFRKRRHVS
jgi:hypothetical protein